MVRHLRFVSSGAVPAFPGLFAHAQEFAPSSIMHSESIQHYSSGYCQTLLIMVRHINSVDLRISVHAS